MVVGDHQIHPQFPAEQSLVHGGNAAVHGDNQVNPSLMELADGDGVQAIAFFQPAGDVADHICTMDGEENPSAKRWR